MVGDIDLKLFHAQVTGQPLTLQERLNLARPGEIVPYEPWELTHPVSHTTDPDTSKAAERSITDSGARKSNNQAVAWLVARFPGKTASEYTQLAEECFLRFTNVSFDKTLIEVRRRLSDMNGIHVRRGDKHEARIGLLKNKESIWWPK